MDLKSLILENECTYLDFKEKPYGKHKKENFVKDVMAMANANIDIERYIILGVKDRPGKNKDIKGLEEEDIEDEANYQELIHSNIEPYLELSYEICKYNGKNLGVLKISNCHDKPYLMKKDLKILKKGDGFIRRGSMQSKLERDDYERIYSQRNNKNEKKEKEIVFWEALIADRESFNCHARDFNQKINHIKNYSLDSRREWKLPKGTNEETNNLLLFNALIGQNIKEINKNFYYQLLEKIDADSIKFCKNELDILTSRTQELKEKVKTIEEIYKEYKVDKHKNIGSYYYKFKIIGELYLFEGKEDKFLSGFGSFYKITNRIEELKNKK